jgi:hypothetical protein
VSQRVSRTGVAAGGGGSSSGGYLPCSNTVNAVRPSVLLRYKAQCHRRHREAQLEIYSRRRRRDGGGGVAAAVSV